MDNCEFISTKDDYISIVTVKEPSAKFKALAIRCSDSGGEDSRGALFSSDECDSVQKAMESLHTKSAEATSLYIKSNGYSHPPKKNRVWCDDDDDDDDASSTGSELSALDSPRSAAQSPWDSCCSDDDETSLNKRKCHKKSTKIKTQRRLDAMDESDYHDMASPVIIRPPPPPCSAAAPAGVSRTIRPPPGYDNGPPPPPPPHPAAFRAGPNPAFMSQQPHQPSSSGPPPPSQFAPQGPGLGHFAPVSLGVHPPPSLPPTTFRPMLPLPPPPSSSTTTVATSTTAVSPLPPISRLHDVRLTINWLQHSEQTVLESCRPSIRALQDTALAYVRRNPMCFSQQFCSASKLKTLSAVVKTAYFGTDKVDMSVYRHDDLTKLFAVIGQSDIPRFEIEVDIGI